MTNVKYYIATSEANDQMYSEGDIIKCDLGIDFDGYYGENLTRGTSFCPFTFNGVKEISEEETINYLLPSTAREGNRQAIKPEHN